jgi:hypothetical protein
LYAEARVDYRLPAGFALRLRGVNPTRLTAAAARRNVIDSIPQFTPT